jgi:hypothetical protein
LFLPDAPDAEDSLEGLASSQAATHQTLFQIAEISAKKLKYSGRKKIFAVRN